MYKPIEKNVIMNLHKSHKMSFSIDKIRKAREGYLLPYNFIFGQYIVATCYVRWATHFIQIDDLDITASQIRETLATKEMNYILAVKKMIQFLKDNDRNLLYVYFYGEKWAETFIDHGFSINAAPQNKKGRYEAKLDLIEKENKCQKILSM